MPADTEPPKSPPTEKSSDVVKRAVSKMPAPVKPGLVKRIVQPVSFWIKYRRQISVVGQHQLNGWQEVFSAMYTGLELAVACATTQMESGGRNIYGSDPASAWMNEGPYGRMWGEPVTQQNALWAWEQIKGGAVSNGFGPKQLTSQDLIQDAMNHGGVWNVQHNMATGDRFFKSLLAESGGNIWTAAYHYNGSGPAAENYANDYCAIVQTWRARLG